uniref:Uncharacterized protein n=1 Tax=Schlesneria paludicola TaxID=360056 RepID=A0A7C2NX65_9PLAN
MWCLYALKGRQPRKLVATFDSEQQLLAYVQWATLAHKPDGTRTFEQKTPLTGYTGFEHENCPDLGSVDLPHNPTPGML